MCIKDFPHFLLKVNSQSNEGDQFRMLLQAACIVRIGNWLRASTSGKPIVIMAIYIDKHFTAYPDNHGIASLQKKKKVRLFFFFQVNPANSMCYCRSKLL